MYSSQTIKKFLTIAVILTIVAMGLYIAFFLHIREKNQSISTISNEVDLVVRKETRLRSIQKVIKETADDRGKLDNYFVSGENAVVDFIETIEELGGLADVDVTISSVSIDALDDATLGEESSDAELLRINFEAEGSWEDLFHLFALVELLPFKVTITQSNFQLLSTRDREDEEILTPRWKGTFGVTVVTFI